MDGESRAGYVWVPKSEDVEFKGGFFVVIYMLWSLEWPAGSAQELLVITYYILVALAFGHAVLSKAPRIQFYIKNTVRGTVINVWIFLFLINLKSYFKNIKS